MPSSRRPQARPKQQPREYFRCARCGSDAATDHGVMLHIVEKHGRQRLLPGSAVQFCNLDRAAVIACDTIRSRRGRRCTFCKSDTPIRDLRVGDTFQDRRQPGHQDAAPDGHAPLVTNLFRARSRYLQVTPLTTARYQTAPSGTSLL